MRTILLLLLTLPFLTACGVTERRAFVNRDPDQLWEAMKAVAQEPDYYTTNMELGDRWVIRANDVAYDDNARRIEVYRKLERETHRPLSPVTREEREWRFEIVLEQTPPPELHTQPAPPVMRFTARNVTVAAHVWDEAQWYFDEVERFLGPLPTTAPAQ